LQRIRASNPGPLTLDGTCSYLLGESQLVLIDPGPALDPHLALLQRAAKERPTTICLTHAHADHADAASELMARLGAPVAASAETLRRLGLRGRSLADGDVIEVDSGKTSLEALHTPGHSGDGLSYLWHPTRALFTGDLVLGEGSSMVAHPDGSVADYLASLNRLIELAPMILFPGHGPPVEDAIGKLEEYRDHRLERQREIVEAITVRGARTVAEIRAAVYGDLPDPRVAEAADLSVRAHLEYVRELGAGLADELGGGR
jgi:glyoxylase-like metal-dependent hydrolase (beta-lactamase superfamily II)